jgi:hypothetical protein
MAWSGRREILLHPVVPRRCTKLRISLNKSGPPPRPEPRGFRPGEAR